MWCIIHSVKQFLPVYGQISTAHWTCPGCGALQNDNFLYRKQGIHKCPVCETSMRLGIHVLVLPRGCQARVKMPPDAALPRSEQLAKKLRDRPRLGRLDLLRELGIDPNACSASRYTPGDRANSVTAIPDSAA